MASVHRPVLVSTFAPVALSSSGAVATEVQPETRQAKTTTVMMHFIFEILARHHARRDTPPPSILSRTFLTLGVGKVPHQ